MAEAGLAEALRIDNYRCVELAKRTPCVVIGVDYRLADSEVCYPKPLMDCYTALNYIYDHADEARIDHTKIQRFTEQVQVQTSSPDWHSMCGIFGGPEISLYSF